jgi:hypothetical protein
LVGTSQEPSSDPCSARATFSHQWEKDAPEFFGNIMKQPWLKFFPSDWRADPALRMCSLAARGLWIEMLCLMHEARPHGSLLVNGKPVTAAQLANLVGAGIAEVEGFLAELEEAGVFSRDADGALYSRRMRRDEERAAVNRVNGRAGGNPSLKASVNPPDNPPVKAGVKAQKPESRIQTPQPATGAKLDEIEAACRAALGEAAPVDVVIGPMLAVVERFGAERVCLALASEARRKRRRPIKSWRLWAEIVCESLAEEPRAPPPAPGEMAALLNGESVPRAALMAAIERWNAGGDWPTSLGGPPRRHGCALPEAFLAMCAEV